MRVAFLGLGKMGSRMAGHVLAAGHDLSVWNRTPGRDSGLVAGGARAAASPREAASGADAVVTMLFDASAVREVLLGEPDGAAFGAPAGALVVDASTIGPAAARDVATALAERGLRFVDAPVAGSTPVAERGELGVFAGGSDADVAAARPLLETWGDPQRVRHVGPRGSGQAMKLVMNLSLAVAMAGVGECLRLGHDLALDQAETLDVLAGGPCGWTLQQKREQLAAQEYEPATFALEAMTKDVRLAVEAAVHDLRVAAATLAAADDAVTAGHGSDDYAALAGYLAFEGHLNSW